MAWTKIIPRWEGATAEPPEQKKTDGFIPGDKPPAFWENWFRKGIQEAVNENRDEIDTKVSKSGDTMTGSLGLPKLDLVNQFAIVRKQSLCIGNSAPVSATGVREFVVDLGIASPSAGTIKITLSSSFGVGNLAGSLSKSVDIQYDSTVIGTINSVYDYIGKNMIGVMIGDPYVESGRLKFKIFQQNGYRNTVHLVVETFGTFQDIKGATVSDWVTSTEPFVAPKGNAIHSQGSNSNGEWIRFEDGTQMCYHRISANATANTNFNQVWSFPSSFIDISNVKGQCTLSSVSIIDAFQYSSPPALTPLWASPSTQGKKFGFNANVSQLYTFDLMAIGKWR